MIKLLKTKYYALGGAITMGSMSLSGDAYAQDNNFNKIANNISDSISNLPGLISALAYLFGLLLAVLGIMKIKDHVENPTQTPLKDGAIRLAAGGALFALPIVSEAMLETVGSKGEAANAAKLNSIDFDSTFD